MENVHNNKMTHPFNFRELRLTDKMLDVLGFSEYWAGSGDFYGERCFGVEGVKLYRILCYDETPDPCSGYCGGPIWYQSEYFSSSHFANKVFRNIHFLHDLYEDISDNAPELLEMFIEKTKEKGVNMYTYIKSYLDEKNTIKENI